MTAGVSGGDGHGSDTRMALAQQWDELVERVRTTVPGLDGFQRPPAEQELRQAATGGPVVVINVGALRCDALIVTQDRVRAHALPLLSATDVARRTADYLGALRSPEVPQEAPELSFTEAIAQRFEAAGRRERVLRDTMDWLWTAVAEPVLAELGHTAAPRDGTWPRVRWCPTGLLTLLPIHGAARNRPDGDECVLDRVVSSYTPTLRALIEAARPRPEAGADRLAFVGAPHLPGRLRMAGDIGRERALLTGLFPGGLDVLDGPRATTDAVLDLLRTHRYAHISCHGHQDLGDPSAAGLELADGLLGVRRIAANPALCEFVFLSACRTATGGVRLADETITLAAALSYAGFRHVVATLWSVDPAVAAELAERFYPRLVVDGSFDPSGAAQALHHALRELRDAGAALEDWLPFVHNGV